MDTAFYRTSMISIIIMGIVYQETSTNVLDWSLLPVENGLTLRFADKLNGQIDNTFAIKATYMLFLSKSYCIRRILSEYVYKSKHSFKIFKNYPSNQYAFQKVTSLWVV